MAITLMTGLPGACKTLYSLSFVNEWSKRDSRPVFYSGIKDLNIPDWTEIDAEKWFECPANSIVLIDECQRIFRPRSAGKEPPKFVSELETHRHQGIDIWLITQHPNLCDIAVRRLTQRHFHAHRIFGMERATIHEWQGAQPDCEKESAKKKSVKKIWKFDKKAYEFYKSAEVHTVKRSVPKQVIMLAVLPLIVIGLGYSVYKRMIVKPVESTPSATAGTLVDGARSQKAGQAPVFDALADAKNYVQTRTPRVEGLGFTAPIYDEVRKPTEAPLPVACVKSSVRCTCYSQQATVLPVGRDMCLEIVANGFFDDSPKKIEAQNANYSQGSAPASSPVSAVSYAPAFSSPNAVPASQIAVASQAGNSRDASRDGYGLLGRAGKGVREPKYD